MISNYCRSCIHHSNTPDYDLNGTSPSIRKYSSYCSYPNLSIETDKLRVKLTSRSLAKCKLMGNKMLIKHYFGVTGQTRRKGKS
jgi:hypothetical protein